jgi:restriction system protein
MAQYQREVERRDRATQRALLTAAREADRARRAYERAQYLDEKERKRLYAEARRTEVEAMNERLAAENTALEAVLRATLNVDDFIDFAALKRKPELPPFQPGELATAGPAPEVVAFTLPPLSGMSRLKPGAKAKHEQAVEEARNRYDAEKAAHERRERERRRRLAEGIRLHLSEWRGQRVQDREGVRF